MSKDPIGDFLKGAIALCTLVEKGAKFAEKQSKKNKKNTKGKKR